ncbi:TFIIA-alpha and beta-like factor isoform X2 [Bubalus bubalis]|uniref:TFIIA-alpha and beta-like factor isoform X2 n=1 Tax=Bubalus bubalis TaxID=89462 RepID=UPI001E1B7965|nr:TFIIA-alpha and beta-like factor isoform X2 [Bubalus bubalis]
MSLLFSSLLIQTEAKLYRSVIEDVIEGVRDLFAEEGVEEQVLKDLKQLWETKVLQSKATEDFFRNSVHSPLFTLQLPHSLHQTLQSSAASFVIPAGRTRPSFTAAELGTSNSSASFTFPGYPIHVPVGVTQQTTSAHLCKVSVPFMVTQTSERASILQHPVQQVFQLLGQPSIIQTSIPQLNPCFLQATTEKSLRMETVLQQPIVLPSETVDKKHLENTTSDILVPPGNEHKIISEALLNQLDSSSQMDLSIRVTDGDVNEIIQIGGTGDTSSNDEIGNTRDVDENGLLGITDAGDLKVTEEETGSVSNEDSSVNSSDNEDPEIDLLEEDPLNSGDDVSEQDVPDLFDMDNVIVCQYDKGIIRQENDHGGEAVVDSPTRGKEGTCSFQDLVEHSGHLSLVSTQAHMISFFYVLLLFFFFFSFCQEKMGEALTILGELYQFLVEINYLFSR